MKLLIDADACPVVNLAIGVAGECGVLATLICDDAHEMKREGAETITVSRGADSADFRLVNLISAGDAVITQDYGLAAMCMAKGASVLDQNGMAYTRENIEGLLWQRHEARKLRRSGKHTKGPKKRTDRQDLDFAEALKKLLKKHEQMRSDGV